MVNLHVLMTLLVRLESKIRKFYMYRKASLYILDGPREPHCEHSLAMLEYNGAVVLLTPSSSGPYFVSYSDAFLLSINRSPLRSSNSL